MARVDANTPTQAVWTTVHSPRLAIPTTRCLTAATSQPVAASPSRPLTRPPPCHVPAPPTGSHTTHSQPPIARGQPQPRTGKPTFRAQPHRTRTARPHPGAQAAPSLAGSPPSAGNLIARQPYRAQPALPHMRNPPHSARPPRQPHRAREAPPSPGNRTAHGQTHHKLPPHLAHLERHHLRAVRHRPGSPIPPHTDNLTARATPPPAPHTSAQPSPTSAGSLTTRGQPPRHADNPTARR
ncbi:hypothetical protein SAMN04487818_103285 [Actinokineospora terrae]|uniref:Uncharacterized protein n=1 Tax=Actinokineospora terrae TaxID=155974 RepID=A0A1H9P503_9PSEU|nr:hypothetical protein SAMN04487818_103285 [Actinokineospora terrae]